MKKLLIALTLLTLSPRLATAQEVETPVVLEKVTYSRAVPKALRAFVPRGGKSRFWGATKLRFEGQTVWVHVYDVRKIKADEPQKRGLDLFVSSKSHELHRISSTRFEHARSTQETVGVKTFWIDPKTKKLSLVEIDFNDPTGYYGTLTKIVLVIFDQKFGKAIVQDKFEQGITNVGGDRTTFGLDKNGLLNIFSYYIMLGTGTYS